MAEWAIWVRDRDRELVALVDDFATATFLPTFNDVGGWLIRGIPVGSDAQRALVPGSGIVAVRDGVVVMSGPMLWPVFDWSGDGYVLDVSGSSDDLALWGRLCYPAAPSIDLNAAYSDDRGPDPAETVMKGYVDVNAGPGADPLRQWSGLVIAPDLGIGADVSFSARLDTLGDVLVELALAGGGLGFSVRQEAGGTDLVFDVWEPDDATGTARFSTDLQNLSDYRYGRKAASVNNVVVGGQGEGTLRTFIVLDNPVSSLDWNMRLEGFRDQRQTAIVSELVQAGQEELDTKGDQVSLDLTPVETEAVRFGVEYNVGSRVTVLIDGEPIQDTVRSVELGLGAGGETIRPMVGTPGAVEAGTSEQRAIDVLLDRMSAMSRRLSRVERAE